MLHMPAWVRPGAQWRGEGHTLLAFFVSTDWKHHGLPIGHRKRRADGLPVLVKKFELSFDARFSPSRPSV